jgi:hypothetical protein
MFPIHRFLLLLLPALLAAPKPAAAHELLPGFTLRAAIGGAVPYARKDSYLVANLAGSQEKFLNLSSTPLLSSQVGAVFDSRPQLMLGGGLPLLHLGEARLSLTAVVSAGATPPLAEPRPVLGLAALRLVF